MLLASTLIFAGPLKIVAIRNNMEKAELSQKKKKLDDSTQNAWILKLQFLVKCV